jgi:hypothetical protein
VFAAAGSAAEAAFIRDLFFDTRTKPVGVLSQGGLRDAAREKAKLSDGAFRDLQRAHFREFAGFLLTLTSAKGVDPTLPEAAYSTLARYARAVQAESTRQMKTWVGVETKSGVINIAPVRHNVSANDLQSLLTVLG